MVLILRKGLQAKHNTQIENIIEHLLHQSAPVVASSGSGFEGAPGEGLVRRLNREAELAVSDRPSDTPGAQTARTSALSSPKMHL